MKPFEELSYHGKIRRMRLLAQTALNAYGLCDIRFKFIRQAGNTIFQVNELNPSITAKPDRYKSGQYLLRIHQPGYQSADGIELELSWLRSMCQDADLPVPEPVSRMDGNLLTQVSIPGIPGQRNCSLLRWLKGREITKGVRPYHYRALGKLMAKMHDHAARWQPPLGLTKRRYDWDGLFSDSTGEGLSAREAWSLLPQDYIEPYKVITRKVKQVMDKWGKGPDVYGLIHADLGFDANALFWKGEARAIDFDDSGFGYYMYDLAITLENCQDDETLPKFREALLDGYTRIRSLPEEPIKYLDLFLAAFYVFLSLWAASAIQAYPDHKEELLKRMERAYQYVNRFNNNS